MKTVLVLLVLLGATTCHAQLPNDRGVAPMFLSWEVAWRDTDASTQERLAWVPKARKGNWNLSDKPFLQAEKEVEQKWLALKDLSKVVEFYKQRAIKQPIAVNNFSWGYAEWLHYTRTGSIRATYRAQLAMSKTFVPSFRYIRVLFLLPSQPKSPKTLEPIAQKMLLRAPNDLRVKTQAAEVIGSLPILRARRQSENLHKELISSQPNSYRWSNLGHFYSQWWGWNSGDITRAKSAADRKLSKELAIRDAKLAISAWRKSIALSSDPKWRDVRGPQLIKDTEDWLRKNS